MPVETFVVELIEMVSQLCGPCLSRYEGSRPNKQLVGYLVLSRVIFRSVDSFQRTRKNNMLCTESNNTVWVNLIKRFGVSSKTN